MCFVKTGGVFLGCYTLDILVYWLICILWLLIFILKSFVEYFIY